MGYWIGQAFGLLATMASISMPVFKKKWQMLVMNITNNVSSGLSLVFLGQMGSGIFLFVVAATQGVMNLIHTLRNTKGKSIENAVFLALYLALGFYGYFTGEGYVPGINARNLLELMPILGAVLSMCFIAVRKESHARLFLLACNTVWTVYYAIIGSSAGIGTFIGTVTGVFAIWKHREKEKTAE